MIAKEGNFQLLFIKTNPKLTNATDSLSKNSGQNIKPTKQCDRRRECRTNKNAT